MTTIYLNEGVVSALCDLTAKLVDMRMRHMDSVLCTEDVGPAIFGNLLHELGSAAVRGLVAPEE